MRLMAMPLRALLSLALLLALGACASRGGIVAEPSGSGATSLPEQLSAVARPAAGPRTVFIGAALWGSEGVFDRDVELLHQDFAQRFGDGYRALRFSNAIVMQGPRALPLAMPQWLRSGLQGLKQGHRAGDRYIVLLTSHGSAGSLNLEQPAVYRGHFGWAASAVGELLKELPPEAPVWVIVSACFSGSLLPALQRPHWLVMTAARADRPSFGCGDKSPNTWFVKSLSEALADEPSMAAVWQGTLRRVVAREKQGGLTASEPQWQVGEQLAPGLQRPWTAF